MDYEMPITYTLEIENIGIIKNACIEFGGLTVIAGENDTGKSTVGKLIFSLIKSLSRYEEDLELGDKEKLRIIYDIITRLYFILRKKTNNVEIIKRVRDIREETQHAVIKCDLDYVKYNILPKMEELCNLSKEYLDGNNNENISPEEIAHMSMIIAYNIGKIKSIIDEPENKLDIIKKAFKRMIYSEFDLDICNKFSNGSSIRILYGKNEILNISMKNNKNNRDKDVDISITLNEDELFYKDAIYIESPIILHIHHAIKYSDTFGLSGLIYGRRTVPFHLKDLIKKLEIGRNIEIIEDFEKDNWIYNLNKDIISIINGEVIYSNESSDFEYVKRVKDKKCIIKSINIATGIKSFGILQMLINSGYLNDKTILIIDEPEVHLHPEWQLKYAHVIVKLVKYGIPVVISSHSPYMIQALRYYAMKEEIDDRIKFYLSEKDDDELVYIKDVTDDLNQIFTKLAKPLGKVM